MNSYRNFTAMITTSTVVMFGLMYLNTYDVDHLFFSETRAYMALMMGATMAVIMLGFMLHMYSNRRLNAGICAGGTVVFVAALWLVRSQATVDDVAYMKAMIPHHSIAILTSEHAHISDPRVRKLADRIHRDTSAEDRGDESADHRPRREQYCVGTRCRALNVDARERARRRSTRIPASVRPKRRVRSLLRRARRNRSRVGFRRPANLQWRGRHVIFCP